MKNTSLIGAIILLIFSCTGCRFGARQEPPNIVMVLADDLGWADVGYNGAVFYETLNIDRLAQEGMVLNRFYPSAANCSPSRACMMTGMYSPRHSVYLPQGLSRGGEVSRMRWKVPTHGQDSTFHTFHVSINNVDAEFTSLAELLKKKGYVSARLGKWHIGDDNQGFDSLSANGVPGYITNLDGNEDRFYDDTTVAEKLTDAAIDFIRANLDRPFFLYLPHWEVHTPMAARKERIDHFSRKLAGMEKKDFNPVYAAEIEQLDISLGRIVKALEEMGIEDRTMVIFTSDNGGLMEQTSNHPLRGGKGMFYEGGIRTPFVVKWPGLVKPASQSNTPVIGIDLMPTFAEITGLDVPRNQPVDGVSVLPLLKGKDLKEERTLFFHFPLYLGGSEKSSVLPAYSGTEYLWRAVPSTTIMKGDWKLIYYYEYDRYELFNLKEDLSEQHDLSGTEKDVAKALLEELHTWVREVNAPVPGIPNDLYHSGLLNENFRYDEN